MAGRAPAHKLMHARILLTADQSAQGPAETDDAIAEAVEVSQPTVFRVRRHYVEQRLEAALNRRPSTREYPRKLDGAQEAHLIALACETPPNGQAHWSLRLLADKLVELEVVAAQAIELSVLSRQCLDRRAPDAATLAREVAAWRERRNAAAAAVEWRFTTQDARIKLKRLCPSVQG